VALTRHVPTVRTTVEHVSPASVVVEPVALAKRSVLARMTVVGLRAPPPNAQVVAPMERPVYREPVTLLVADPRPGNPVGNAMFVPVIVGTNNCGAVRVKNVWEPVGVVLSIQNPNGTSK